jgi:hypothetical protein
MRRAILLLMLGIFCTALFGTAISVYLFHDVDKDKIGHWNEAFAGLCTESVLFTVVVGGGDSTSYFSRAASFSSRGILSSCKIESFSWHCRYGTPISLGLRRKDGISKVRRFLSCSIVIVRDNFRQMKLRQAPAASFDC